MIIIAGVEYFELADSITASNLLGLAWADGFIGYVNGNWPDYDAIKAEHPGKPVYGLTVFADPKDGDGTDSEPGNASIAQTVVNTKGELARGIDRPIVYCPASWASEMVTAHAQAGVARAAYRLLTAHYGWPRTLPGFQASEHICGPATCEYGPGSNGTQWQNGSRYDRSLVDSHFIAAAPHPGPSPTPTPIPGENMQQLIAQIPIGPNGEGEAIYDGGVGTQPGVTSLNPAIPYGKFIAATAYGPDTVAGDPDWGPIHVDQQVRSGYLYLHIRGAQAVPGQVVERTVATVTFAD